MRDMISNILTSHLIFDLEAARSVYDSVYDEMDLTDTERLNGASIATACREFLSAFEAKTASDLR